MAKKSISSWVWIVGIVVILALMAVSYYNNFVGLNENVDTQWAKVETQYQRRFDLVPSLVNSTKGYLTQEQAIYDKITEARVAYSGAQSTNEKAAAASQLEGFLGRLLVIVEDNPELKSNETVADLMTQLEGTENRISTERTRYNDEVKIYNKATKRFPGVIFAKIFGFGEKNFFESTEGAELAPEVNLEVNLGE